MKRTGWFVLAGIIVALGLAWYFLRSGGERVAVDLIEQFPQAKEKRPRPETFSIVDATISGQTKKAILASEPSRLTYSVTVPNDAELKLSVGILEQGWTVPGDGVRFRVLVNDRQGSNELLVLDFNPFGNPADRGWHDLTIDLSEYAGETVDLLFNTNASPPQRPPKDDRNGDFPVWAQPRIVGR
jgi:hypothetical protein